MRRRILCVCKRFGSDDSEEGAPLSADSNQGAGAACMPTKDCNRIAVLWSIVAAEYQ
jgi:hypothetical protein